MNVEIPCIGTEKERNLATKIFNEKLYELCQKHGWGFMSIFEQIINADLTTKAEYISGDNCHLSQSAMVLLEQKYFMNATQTLVKYKKWTVYLRKFIWSMRLSLLRLFTNLLPRKSWREKIRKHYREI